MRAMISISTRSSTCPLEHGNLPSVISCSLYNLCLHSQYNSQISCTKGKTSLSGALNYLYHILPNFCTFMHLLARPVSHYFTVVLASTLEITVFFFQVCFFSCQSTFLVFCFYL